MGPTGTVNLIFRKIGAGYSSSKREFLIDPSSILKDA
jgi:hypothetical protein